LSITQGTKYYGLEKEITSLVIKPRNITIEIGTINTTYGDAEVTEIPTSIVSGEIVEGESLNLTFTREEGTNVGEYSISGNANNENYNVTVEDGLYVIAQKEIEIIINGVTVTYGEIENETTYIIPEGSIVGEDEIGLSISRETGKTVGKYKITAAITNTNYKLSQNEAIYEITKRPITIKAQDKTVTYGESAELQYNITSGNIVNEDELNIKISRETGEDVGEYVITVTAENSNYDITLENGTYKITPKDATIDVLNIVNEPKTYNGNPQGIEVSVKEGINGLGHIKVCYDGVETIPTNAGTYKVTIDIEAGANYEEQKGIEVGNFVINQKEIGIEIQNQTSVYGDEEKAIDYILDEEKIVGEDEIGLNVTREQGNTVGEYDITATITNPNYKLTQNEAIYEITKRPITISAVDKTVTYGESANLEHTITSGNIVNEDELNIQISRETGEDVGEYVITVTAENSNYEITLENGTYKITPKDASQDLLNIVNEPKTYNGDAQGIEASVKEGINGLGHIKIYYDGVETIPTNAGTYKVTIDIEAGKNYNEVKELEVGNFVINKRQIEIEIGTVNATYGDEEVSEIPTSITSGELVEGESLNLTFTREQGTDVGEYVISGQANNENYDVTVEDGLYVIAEKEIQITIDSITQTYGETEKTITYKIPDGSIVGEDDIGLNVTREQGNIVGEYDITAIVTNTNYKLTQNEAKYEITKRPITIKAVDITVSYGQKETLFHRITSGSRVNNDELNISVTREEGENVGEYVITVTAENSNYDITLENGVYKIEQAEELRVTYPKASNIKYTQKLKESILTTEGEQFGTFSWKNGDLVLNAGTTNQTVVFTPSDLTKRNYKTIVNPEEEVQITVEKANQSDIKLKISSSYVEIGKNAVAPTLTIENKAELKGTIKYSSSNEKVATINEEGIISLVGEIGKTTITVTSNEDNSNTNYEPATKTIELEVGDKTAPEIIIDNTVLKNTIFEAGYEDEFNDKIDGIITITDNYDTEVSKTITGLKIKEVGTQTITITATDSEGNEAQKNVKIKIIDSEAPTIKLQNAIDKNQEFVRGDKYVRPQFILEDNSSDASNISVERTGFLDMTTKGRYSIKYTAEDEYGNRSEPLEVQVTVLDYAPAIVYVKDNFKYLVEEGKEYSHFLDIEFEGSGELVKNGTEIIGYKSGIRLTDGEYVLTVTNDLCKTAKVSFSINTSGPEITAVVNLNGTTTRKKLEDNTPVFQGITTFEFDEKVVNAVLYQVSNGALTEIASGKENVLAHELSETGLKTYSLLIEDANGETETRNFYVFN